MAVSKERLEAVFSGGSFSRMVTGMRVLNLLHLEGGALVRETTPLGELLCERLVLSTTSCNQAVRLLLDAGLAKKAGSEALYLPCELAPDAAAWLDAKVGERPEEAPVEASEDGGTEDIRSRLAQIESDLSRVRGQIGPLRSRVTELEQWARHLVPQPTRVYFEEHRWPELTRQQFDVYLAAFWPQEVSFDPHEIGARLQTSREDVVRDELIRGAPALTYLISGAVEPSVLTLLEARFVVTLVQRWHSPPYVDLLHWVTHNVRRTPPYVDVPQHIAREIARVDFPESLGERLTEAMRPLTNFSTVT